MSARAEARRAKRAQHKTAVTYGPRPVIIGGRVWNRRTRRHPQAGQQ